MKVFCDGCRGHLGEADGHNAKVKARYVDIANGRIRVKCPKCHKFTEIPGVQATRKSRMIGVRGKVTD